MPAGTRSAVKVHLKLIDEYTRQIAGQDRRLERLRKKDVRAQSLETIPGIGKYSSPLLLAEIGDIRRLANKRALNQPRLQELRGPDCRVRSGIPQHRTCLSTEPG